MRSRDCRVNKKFLRSRAWLLGRNTQRRTISSQMNGTDLRQRQAAILAAHAAGDGRLSAVDARPTAAVLDAFRVRFRAWSETSHDRVIDTGGGSLLAARPHAGR